MLFFCWGETNNPLLRSPSLIPREKSIQAAPKNRSPVAWWMQKRSTKTLLLGLSWRLRGKSIPHSEAEALPGDQSCGGVLNPEGLFISSRSFPKDFEGPSNGRVNKPVWLAGVFLGPQNSQFWGFDDPYGWTFYPRFFLGIFLFRYSGNWMCLPRDLKMYSQQSCCGCWALNSGHYMTPIQRMHKKIQPWRLTAGT